MRIGFFLLILGAFGCGDDSSSGGGAESPGSSSSSGGDGKVHPDENGVAMTEDAACQALRDALSAEQQSMQGCVMTIRTCPSLVQIVGGEPCLQYDQGTVQGCIAHYQAATDCEDLKKRNDECVFEAIEASAPSGCP